MLSLLRESPNNYGFSGECQTAICVGFAELAENIIKRTNQPSLYFAWLNIASADKVSDTTKVD